jgi:hypothetical protein
MGYLFAIFSICAIFAERVSYIEAISAIDAQVASAPKKANI